jgi:hypothetical protein
MTIGHERGQGTDNTQNKAWNTNATVEIIRGADYFHDGISSPVRMSPALSYGHDKQRDKQKDRLIVRDSR